MKKFKLIKNHPKYFNLNLGDIVNFIEADQVEISSEYFSKYIFTTFDNVDIFENEKCYYLNKFNWNNIDYGIFDGNGSNGLYFSTKEALQTYLNVLFERKFESILLDEAKKRYDNATAIESVLNPKMIYPYSHFKTANYNYYYQNGNVILQHAECNSGGIVVYSNSKWANIIEDNEYYGVCCKGSWEIINTKNSNLKKTRSDSWKWFESESERSDYIEKNKPRYSMNDFLNFINLNRIVSNIYHKTNSFIVKNNLINSIINIVNDVRSIYYLPIFEIKLNSEESELIIYVYLPKNIYKIIGTEFFKKNNEMKNPNINKYITITFESTNLDSIQVNSDC
jgi:hypothetical protein